MDLTWERSPDSRAALVSGILEDPAVQAIHEEHVREGYGYIPGEVGREFSSQSGIGRVAPLEHRYMSPLETTSLGDGWDHVCNNIRLTTYDYDEAGRYTGHPLNLSQFISLEELTDEEFYGWMRYGEVHVPDLEDRFSPSPLMPEAWVSSKRDLRLWLTYLAEVRRVLFGCVVIRGECEDGLEAEYSNAISSYVNMRVRVPRNIFSLGNISSVKYVWPEPGPDKGRLILAAMPHLHGLSHDQRGDLRVFHVNGAFKGRYTVTLQEFVSDWICTRDVEPLKERAWDKWQFEHFTKLSGALHTTGTPAWPPLVEGRARTGGSAGKLIAYWIPDRGCPRQIARMIARRHGIKEALITLIGATEGGIRLYEDDRMSSDWFSPRYYEYMALGRIRPGPSGPEVDLYTLPGNDWGYVERHGWLVELSNLNLGSAFIHVIRDEEGAYDRSVPAGLVAEGKSLSVHGGARDFLDMLGLGEWIKP